MQADKRQAVSAAGTLIYICESNAATQNVAEIWRKCATAVSQPVTQSAVNWLANEHLTLL